jgi:hypothetical protein
MVYVDGAIVKRCVEPKERVPIRGTLFLRFHTSFHYCVIYINHMVTKVITIYGQPYGFQG